MKKQVVSLCRMAVVLLLLVGFVGCQRPDQPVGAVPEGALSFDQMIANLDTLQGPAAQSASAPGRSVFRLPGGALFSLQDLSTYVNAIKKDFAAYVSARTGGKPYLVVPTKLQLPGPNSGLMWVPFTWGKGLSAPVISYQHGTQVLRECAPSQFNPNPLAVFSSLDPSGALQSYVECIVAGLMASAGYIVVMPDYPGFGDSFAPHPYVQMSLGDSVRDIVVTAQAALAGRTVTTGTKIFLTGYSEGGYATMEGARALQGIGINVTATVPCDGAYDLSGVMLDQMLSTEQIKVPSYLLYTASGYKAMYPAIIDYNTLLVAKYADLLTNHSPFDGYHTTAQVEAAVPSTTIPSSMLTDFAKAYLLNPGQPVYKLLDANNAYYGWLPAGPLVLVHCKADDVVPYKNAEVARDWFRGLGYPDTLVSIVDVAAVPFVATLLGSKHVAAFPTAMLAAFAAIETVNKGY